MEVKSILAKLDKELIAVMEVRAYRLSNHRIWLKHWLRYHKIKREYRKLAKIMNYRIVIEG